MAFKIDEFASEHNRRKSVYSPNRFEVVITNPGSITSQSSIKTDRNTANSISFWCESAQFPGYQLLSHNVRRYTYGTNETRPFSPNFQPVQLIFATDNNMDVWEFFNAWMQNIIPHDVRTGMADTSAYSQHNLVYELSYKSEYVTDVQITLFNQEGQKIITTKLRQAFPSNLNAVDLAWSEQNQYARFAVFLEYLDWTTEKFATIGQSSNSIINDSSIFNIPT